MGHEETVCKDDAKARHAAVVDDYWNKVVPTLAASRAVKLPRAQIDAAMGELGKSDTDRELDVELVRKLTALPSDRCAEIRCVLGKRGHPAYVAESEKVRS